jgi:hypothetical protein
MSTSKRMSWGSKLALANNKPFDCTRVDEFSRRTGSTQLAEEASSCETLHERDETIACHSRIPHR